MSVLPEKNLACTSGVHELCVGWVRVRGFPDARCTCACHDGAAPAHEPESFPDVTPPDVAEADYPPLHVPVIVTDGGPWAVHDQACAVCQERKAVLNIGTGHFSPCWSCQREGWALAHRRRFGRWRQDRDQ